MRVPEKIMTGASLSNDDPDFQQPRIPRSFIASSKSHRPGNIFQHLARREVSSRAENSSKRPLRETAKCIVDSIGSKSGHDLVSWVESESLKNLAAKYCTLLPPPRSTIAAAFSPDGKRLASTHGDHTVKIIDCHTGKCLKVLSGHRRTPWVVRFHPLLPDILASGSLDHEVRLWDARTGECIASRDFYRPIASLAFHAQGELLAVASGHKLYIWQYKRTGVVFPPSVVLRTMRSLRAVHFHPHSTPFLLTAEVNDLDPADSSMTLATSPGYSPYAAPTVYFTERTRESSTLANGASLESLPYLTWPSSQAHQSDTRPRVDTSASVRIMTYSTPSGHYELLISPIVNGGPLLTPEEPRALSSSTEMETEVSQSAVNTSDAAEAQPAGRPNSISPAYWDLPFLQGWLAGHPQASQHSRHPLNTTTEETTSAQMEASPSVNPNGAGFSRVIERPQSRNRTSRPHSIPMAAPTDNANVNVSMHGDGHPQPISRIQQEIAYQFGNSAAAELPCTVKLRLWSHSVENPCVPLQPDACQLTIPHAVLCSEMGAHFSPCGRFLAACVACVLRHSEAEPGMQSQASHDIPGLATSPTRHPLSAHQIVYEIRIYSLVKATFGVIVASRAIRAAHCLTSIQFSPTSEHILLAYGRRHCSLLKSVVIDGEATIPIYTILEVYRVCDMELVRVLPSAEDEVNVACFHPSPGGGFVYGTKEGRLRILQFDRSHIPDDSTHELLDEERPTYALEG